MIKVRSGFMELHVDGCPISIKIHDIIGVQQKKSGEVDVAYKHGWHFVDESYEEIMKTLEDLNYVEA